ncbi:hypothetical protein F4819DRAFT_150161 [Hypoxylon fuscum]|nr:hypothetical protein F4819DRAFT_150161 [Hypoxylon fuscum]
MADQDPRPDFQAMVSEATAEWLQRNTSLNRSESVQEDPTISDSHPVAHDLDLCHKDGDTRPASSSHTVENNELVGKTTWEVAKQALPDEKKSVSFPTHSLAKPLEAEPPLRLVEWNPYRAHGTFAPRASLDYCSLMIYISGQVNQNPCRNCRHRNGPFLRCVVAPPKVLAISSFKHVCANCTYQNQHKKCVDPSIREEKRLTRNRIPGEAIYPEPKPKPTPVLDPNVNNADANARVKHKPDQNYMVRKPTTQNISADGFAEKLRQARGWSPRSRRRMKAEVMQWHAAIMTVNAEGEEGEEDGN